MQNWMIDPGIKDYVMEGGAPKQTDSLLVPAYFRMKIPRTQWMYAPDAQYGSDFYAVKKNFSSSDASSMENIGAKALKPLIDDGRADEIEVTAAQRSRHGVGLQTRIIDARGENEETVFVPIGAR